MFGFKHAIQGLRQTLKTERNFKIHLIAFIIVVGLGVLLDISLADWINLLLISGLVFALEIVNTAIEKLCDLYSTEQNKKIKDIKDISAGAVLTIALFAVVIGIFIFLPYLKT